MSTPALCSIVGCDGAFPNGRIPLLGDVDVALCERHFGPIEDAFLELSNGEVLLVSCGAEATASLFGNLAQLETDWYSGAIERHAFLVVYADDETGWGALSVEAFLLGREPANRGGTVSVAVGCLGGTTVALAALAGLFLATRDGATVWPLLAALPLGLYFVSPSVTNRITRTWSRLAYRLRFAFGVVICALVAWALLAFVFQALTASTVIVLLLVAIVFQLANGQRRSRAELAAVRRELAELRSPPTAAPHQSEGADTAPKPMMSPEEANELLAALKANLARKRNEGSGEPK